MPWHCLRVNVWISVFGLLSVFGQGESSELGEQLGIWKNCPDLSYETVVFLVAAVWETGLYSAAQFVTRLFFWILKNCVILKNVALWETGLSKLRNLTNRLYDKLGCVGLLQYGTLGHFKVVANYNSVVFFFFFCIDDAWKTCSLTHAILFEWPSISPEHFIWVASCFVKFEKQLSF